MKITSVRRGIVPGIAALALVLSACGASNEEGGGGGGAAEDSDLASLTGELNGGGATSQEKAQEAWKTAVQGAAGGNLTINYALLGSTDGRSQFVSGALSFAGTDSALTNEEGELDAAVERCSGGEVLQVPAYVSSIAIAYNLPGVDELNLDAETLAGIFDGKITNWNDEAIAATNDGADLPDLEIAPVHRSDDSGTTKNFTDYLGKAAPDAWTYEAEDAFPVSGGQSADGTSGVVQRIGSTEGAIGYADASQTGDLSVVSVKVGEEFVAPSPEGAAKTVEVSPEADDAGEFNMAVSVDRTTTEAGAYPVILLSYLIACQEYEDDAEAENVKGYLSYIVSDEGQAESADFAGSAPLAPATAERAQEIIDSIGASS